MCTDSPLRGLLDQAREPAPPEPRSPTLLRAATVARADVERIVEYMRTFDRVSVRTRIGKAGGPYLEQIDELRERYSFRAASRPALDRRGKMLAFADRARADGQPIEIPARLLDEARRQHYKDVPLEELRGVWDAVQQIEHLARTKTRLLASARRRDIEEAEEEIVDAIAASHDITREPIDASRPLRERIKVGLRRAVAEHTRMEFLFHLLDGNQAGGVVWQYLFKPFADAENLENQYRRNDAEALRSIFSVYTRGELTRRYDVPAARTDRITGTLTKENLLAIALNWGNAYNRDALMVGYGWSQAKVEQILAVLDERDWRAVQAVWDYIDSYWPAARDLEEEVTGLAPEKVEASDVVTRFGTFRGGYYPVSFDAEQSTRQAALDEDADLAELFGGLSARAMTRHGHLIARTDSGGKPLRLGLGVLSDHLSQVVHDLTHRRALIDVARLVRRDRVRDALERSVGREMYQQLGPWLKGIAGDRPRSTSHWLDAAAAHARMGATVVALGFKVTSALMQTLGYTITVNELGPTYAARGLRDAFGNPLRLRQTWEFITERSAMMRDRLTTYDRDVRDYARRSRFSVDDSAWFLFIGYMDLGVSVPTWLGAYRKAMDGKLSNITAGDERAAVDYADSVVRTTQAAGGAKDLASIQRGGELQRLFTMFCSSMSVLFNQFAKSIHGFQMDHDVPRLVASAALLWLLPPMLEALIRGRGPDDDDESWAGWLARTELLYPLGTVVGLRDVASAVDWALVTGRADFRGSPAFDVPERTVGALLAIARAADPDAEVSRANVEDMVLTVGYFAKLPARQAWTTLEYFHDWMTGRTDAPSNPVDALWRAMMTGTPRQ